MRQPCLDAESVVLVVVMSCDTSLLDDREGEFQGVRKLLGVLYGEQQREVIFFDLFGSGFGVNQSWQICLERL